MANTYGASGVYPTPRGQPSIAFDLQPGAARLVPAGTWMGTPGIYSCFQEYDPIQSQWISPGGSNGEPRYMNSDGNNYRMVNLCGTIVGAIVSTAGSAYSATTPPVVSFTNATNAAATAIVGGAVSTTVTVTNGGTGYIFPPLVFLDSPPVGAGYQATANSTLTSGAVSSITITNQGAGYTNVPNIYIINDPRDTVGSGASAVATLTGAGTVTQLIITNNGNPNTTLFPTIAFSSGSAVATPIMVRSIGSFSITTSGSGYSGATIEVTGLGSGLTTTVTNVLTNPKWTTNLVRTRKASIIAPINATGAFSWGGSTLAQSIIDGGIYAGSSPAVKIYGDTVWAGGIGAALPATLTFNWTNPTDTTTLQPV